MTIEDWELRSFEDELIEYGPAEVHGNERLEYSYLEFKGAGRLRNVVVVSALEAKLKAALGKAGAQFHLIVNKDIGHLAPGVKECAVLCAVSVGADETPYGIDLSHHEAALGFNSEKLLTVVGRLCQMAGALATIIGVPLVFFGIGILIAICGAGLWWVGSKFYKAGAYVRGMRAACEQMQARIPNLRLV